MAGHRAWRGTRWAGFLTAVTPLTWVPPGPDGELSTLQGSSVLITHHHGLFKEMDVRAHRRAPGSLEGIYLSCTASNRRLAWVIMD